ncbi:dnaJ homolog subfamily B member 1-like [Impatiens glandulifera]|uniref:dnaJ homolog subfamily B member 1-like n=1 Tax=Impatiens glandulifera TaxID=253017 RepID=UPI001FB195D9|nr:dnaJ homolog subfamily B member 1-like [Impatiens glandulifera]
MGVDYYHILRVAQTATDEDLKKSYKKLAMKWHPDKNQSPGAESKFKQISEAYEILSNPRSRQVYDLYGKEALKSEDGGEGSYRFNPRDAADMFKEFFGGNGGNGEGMKSNGYKLMDVENKLACSLEELYKGSKRKMKISRIVPDNSGKPKMVEEVVSIEIKPGWKKGTKITFPEKGNQEPGFSAGDLVFLVEEKAHDVFKRDGNDLIVHKKISLVDALIGRNKINLVTLDGRNLIVPVKHIVRPGFEVAVEDEGMPISKEPGKKGRLRIKFDVEFPTKLTQEQKSELKRVLSTTTTS